MNKTIVFSIKPIYTKKIFNGKKKYELRRQRPKIKKGVIAIIYATSPQKYIIGHFTVGKIIEEDVKKLWKYYHPFFGISYKEYMNYFADKEQGIAIEILQPIIWENKISLDLIRYHIKDYNPPQSYSYLAEMHPLWKLINEMNPDLEF